MRDRGYDCKVYFMNTSDFLDLNLDADLICLSTITTTAPLAFKIAQVYRNRKIPVVIGGPHVSALPDEALEYTDYVIRGEGEIPLPALVSALNLDTPLKDVPGLSWKNGTQIHHNPLAHPIEDFDSLPFPDYSLIEKYITAFLSPSV